MEHKYKYYKDYEKERKIVINELLKLAETHRAKGYSEEEINQHYEQILSYFDAQASEMDRRYKEALDKCQAVIKASKKGNGTHDEAVYVLVFLQVIVLLAAVMLSMIILSAK